VRQLGIPTVLDRFIQQVLLQVLQPMFDPSFSSHRFGSRPGKRAHDAVVEAQRYIQERRKWVFDFDLAAFFDNLDHRLVMKALGYHAVDKWVLLYVERWLMAPLQTAEGTQHEPRALPKLVSLAPSLPMLFAPRLRQLDNEAPRRFTVSNGTQTICRHTVKAKPKQCKCWWR
jgi:retron-type reverse transcriptase